MRAAEQTAYFVAVFAAGIVAGGLVAVLAALVPTLGVLSSEASAELHRTFDRYIDRYMPAVTVVSGIGAIVILILHQHLTALGVALIIVGLAGTLAVAIISQFFNVPINATIRGFPVDAVPAEYTGLRRRWDALHTMRTLTGTIAFVCYLAAALAR